jgi:hypothetical protein
MKRALLVGLLICATAGAAAADAPDAVQAHIFLHGKFWSGVILRGTDAGWALPVTAPAGSGACVASLRDITPELLRGTDRSERIITPVTPTIQLTRSRFTASHTYRLSLRCGDWRSEESVVQLQPSQAEQRAWLSTPSRNIARHPPIEPTSTASLHARADGAPARRQAD